MRTTGEFTNIGRWLALLVASLLTVGSALVLVAPTASALDGMGSIGGEGSGGSCEEATGATMAETTGNTCLVSSRVLLSCTLNATQHATTVDVDCLVDELDMGGCVTGGCVLTWLLENGYDLGSDPEVHCEDSFGGGGCPGTVIVF